MPELPEVENVRLGLMGSVVGRTITRVSLKRRDIVHGQARPASLLTGRTLTRIDRLGKQLALIGGDEGGTPVGCICVHLGMTGSLRYTSPSTLKAREGGNNPAKDPHIHIRWHLSDGGTLIFRDPRRFGGLWTFDSIDELHKRRWSYLGEDALTITPAVLHSKLDRTRRCLKTALLDQHVLAGLGNIYVDELLFTSRISPLRQACELDRPEIQRLVRQMRALLSRAIQSGGSTLRDYVDADGQSGRFQNQHAVYGRGGQLCTRCDRVLSRVVLAGRSTVYCENCQA